jgi:hypothetical protein
MATSDKDGNVYLNLSVGTATIQINDSRFLPVNQQISLAKLTNLNLTAYLVIRVRTFSNSSEVSLVSVTLSKSSYA